MFNQTSDAEDRSSLPQLPLLRHAQTSYGHDMGEGSLFTTTWERACTLYVSSSECLRAADVVMVVEAERLKRPANRHV